ncbi:MAG: PadR family transcriptional regulator [Desulfurococcaceae archaeon]|jgi:DNA-binding PadR family transcriptional regulator|nr:PadR family transcriptional regulator [Desulfurococcaceae archaeon]
MCGGGQCSCHGDVHTCLRGVPLRGLLNLAILCLIRSRSAHGAEIHRLLKERFGIDVPKPVVYGLLRRLEYLGFVASKWDVEGGGPARRVYIITEEGLEYLDNSLKTLRDARRVIDLILAEGGVGS